MIPLDRCNCPSCAAVRLARRLFLAFIAVLVLLGFLHRNDGRGRMLIEPSPAEWRQPDFMLFAPCPLTNRNLPKHNERIA